MVGNLASSRTEFTKQLESAGQRFRETGRKAIIIVDGLDHVPREENPQESFLAELPSAAAVPDGVIFLLGTQQLELPRLNPTIIQQAREPNRTVLALNEEEVARLIVESATLAHQQGEEKTALALLQEVNGAPALSALHPSWRRTIGLLALDLGTLDIARRMAASLSIPRFDRYEATQENLDDAADAIIKTALLAEATGIKVPEDPPDDHGDHSTLLSATHSKLLELGTISATAKSGDASLVRDMKAIILFFARARPDPRDFRAYRFFSALGEVAQQIVEIAYDLGDKQFRDVVEFIDAQLSQDDTNLARSEAFCLNFAACVFDIDGDAAAGRWRIERSQSAARDGRTPQEAVESHTRLARAFSHLGFQTDAWSSLQSMHQNTFGYWMRAKKEPQYNFWAWSFLRACESSPSLAGANSLTFAQFILGMDKTEGDETAARLVADLLHGASVIPSAVAGITARLIDSNLATWAKIADSALAATARRAPHLAAPVLLTFSRLVVPFFYDGIDRCLQACMEVMPPADRHSPLLVLISSISKWCPPSQRQALLERIKELAPEAE